MHIVFFWYNKKKVFRYLFDGDKDCKDGSDENPQFNTNFACPDGYKMCNNSLQCVSEYYWCDGKSGKSFDCDDGSDEGLHCEYFECHHKYWKCADRLQCIEVKDVCERTTDPEYFHYNCNDKSDEHNQLCGCMENEWPCVDGDGCVKKQLICNGEIDCKDKSDEYEDFCIKWNCSHNYIKCKDDKRCFSVGETCDGKADCLDGTDENGCQTYSCIHGNSKCADNLQCINNTGICDGVLNCRDGSDELCTAPCLENNLIKSTIVRRCSEDIRKCFPVQQFCDGVADCPHGSDEAESGCSCSDWSMRGIELEGVSLCVYVEWLIHEPRCGQIISSSYQDIEINFLSGKHWATHKECLDFLL